MKYTNIIVISMMSLLLVACGGGGGSSTTEPVVTPVVPPVVPTPVVITPVVPDPNAIYETTAELVAAKSFRLEQEYELTVSYKSDKKRNAYLSVCTEFTQGGAGIKVDYNSCLLRTSITGDYAGMLTVANNKDSLVMAIWYLDDVENPRYELWENDRDVNDIKKFEVN